MTINVENVLLFSCLVFFVTGLLLRPQACSDRVNVVRSSLSLTRGHLWISVR